MQWLDDCMSKHTACKIVESPKFMPGRLIDVQCNEDSIRVFETGTPGPYHHTALSSAGDEKSSSLASRFSTAFKGSLDRLSIGPSFLLTSNTSLAEPRVKYTALSHCWGKTKTLRLTHDTYDAYTGLEGIRISDLPATFRDAVSITRRLGVRYLWIDSLCIIQDSKEDWNLQSGQMAAIYTHAWLTLAAAASASSVAGFFPHTDSRVGNKRTIRRKSVAGAQSRNPSRF